jgi:hypothetical protein
MTSYKATFSQEPTPVSFHELKDKTQVTIILNIEEKQTTPEEGQPEEEFEPQTYWEGDLYQYWELTSHVDREAISASPESFVGYLPSTIRQAAKDKAQQHLDHIRATVHVVPVPSYREGWAVMHRAEDDIKMLAGLIAGGLPYFEFADGQVEAPLSVESLKLILQDVMAHEVHIQQEKQACWAAIDAATTEEEVNAALEAYITNH